MSARFFTPILTIAWLTASSTAAAEAPHRFSGEISAGLQYDSNVTIDEIDRVSHVGDIAAVLEAQIGWKAPVGQATDLSFNYDLTQTRHQDFTAFNLQSHAASAQLDHHFGGVTASLNGRYVRNFLAGNGFSSTHQVAAILSRNFGTTYQLRGAYARSERTYDGRPQRDAVNQTLSLDGYYYLSGAANYLSAGVRHSNETANASPFSFDSNALRLKAGRKFRWQAHVVTGQLTWQYEDRRYEGVTASIGAARHDRRTGLLGHLEMAIGHRLTLSTDYAAGDYASNLPSADYGQQVATVRIGAAF